MAPFIAAAAAATLYGCAGALCLYRTVRKHGRFPTAIRAFFLVAVLLHSVSIGMESVSTSGTIISGPNILILFAWVLAIASCFIAAISKHPDGFIAAGSFASASLIVAGYLAYLATEGCALSNSAYEQWPALALHITLFMLATACLAIGAAASLMRIYQNSLLKAKNSRIFAIDMPAIDTLDAVARHAMTAAFPLFTLGMLMGFGHMAAQYAAMSTAGCPGALQYLIPRIAISLAVWVGIGAHVAISHLAPHLMSSRARCLLSAAMFLLVCISLLLVAAG